MSIHAEVQACWRDADHPTPETQYALVLTDLTVDSNRLRSNHSRMSVDKGTGRTTKCLERMVYERNIDDPIPTVVTYTDPGPCDWGEMTDAEVDATKDKSRCAFHGKQRQDALMRALDSMSGGRSLN